MLTSVLHHPVTIKGRQVVDRLRALSEWLQLASAIAIIVLVVAYLVQGSRLSDAQYAIKAYSRNLSREEMRLEQFGVRAVQQNVDARFDDCQALNALRFGLRQQVRQSEATAPLLFSLLPSLNTSVVHQLVKANDHVELKVFARTSCIAYARRAIPAGDRHRYRVPDLPRPH